MRLDDALRRRTSIMLFSPDTGLTHVNELGAEMGRLLGWAPARVADEVTRYRQFVQDMFAWREQAGAANGRATHQANSAML
jgi:glycerol-3-phosphate dehydrogenase